MQCVQMRKQIMGAQKHNPKMHETIIKCMALTKRAKQKILKIGDFGTNGM